VLIRRIPYYDFCITEELVLEESPKWKLLADVLEEIERDDDKNDTKRNSLLFLFLAEPFYTDSNAPKFFYRLRVFEHAY